jgi:hypothetical protein
MIGELPTAGAQLQAEVGARGEGGLRAAARLIVAGVLFIALAGIWACLWVPPSWGF